MYILLHGKDTYRSYEAMRQMVEKFKKDRDPQNMNTIVVDVLSAKSAEIWEQIHAAPFMAEKRLVVIKNVLQGDVDTIQKLHDGIKNGTLPESTVLIFWEDGHVPKKKVAKEFLALLKSQPYSQEFSEMSGNELQGWISRLCIDRGGAIQQDARTFLTHHVGADTWRLSQLIDQLTAFTNGVDIILADVQLFVPEKMDDNIFNLVDAVTHGNAKLAYDMVYEQYRQGKDAMYVYAMLVRQFRILLSIRDLMDRSGGTLPPTAAKMLGIHPYVAKKTAPLAQKFSFSILKKIHEGLIEMDIALKTSSTDGAQLLDVFIGKLALMR